MRKRPGSQQRASDGSWPRRDPSRPRPGPGELLDLPLVFSQRQILDVDGFVGQAGERGVLLTARHLEALDRSGLLVPMFRARRSLRGVRAAILRAEPGVWPRYPQWVFAAEGIGLQTDRDHGYLVPGRAAPFAPRRRFHARIEGEQVQVRESLYSVHQLLDLPDAMELLPAAARVPVARGAWDAARLQHWLDGRDRRDDLTALLTTLDTHYYPRVVGRIRLGVGRAGTLDWYRLDREFDPVAALSWSGWEPADVLAAAEDLLHRAWSVDPLRDWVDLVRQARPEKWQKLRDGARQAVELRIAAESLLLLLEDLHRVGAAPALAAPPRHARGLLDDRLKPDRLALDAVLGDYGLSPHPAVLMVLEGETEMAVLPLVMDELGIAHGESDIQLVNAHTESARGAHSLLVRYAALPRLGPIQGGHAEFRRPPTWYLVAVDADRAYRDPRAREKERDKRVDELMSELPPAYRTDAARSDVGELVRVETWAEGLDFERANFTDDELVRALISTGYAPAGETLETITRKLAAQRADLIRGVPRSLAQVWKTWPRQPGKPELAILLWPALRRRMRSKRSRTGIDSIPAARVALLARDLAARPRSSLLLRV